MRVSILRHRMSNSVKATLLLHKVVTAKFQRTNSWKARNPTWESKQTRNWCVRHDPTFIRVVVMSKMRTYVKFPEVEVLGESGLVEPDVVHDRLEFHLNRAHGRRNQTAYGHRIAIPWAERQALREQNPVKWVNYRYHRSLHRKDRLFLPLLSVRTKIARLFHVIYHSSSRIKHLYCKQPNYISERVDHSQKK